MTSGVEHDVADEIVISGISCRLPESDNMQEFRDNLMNGIDMVTEDDRRWKPGILGLPKRTGKLKDLSKFDAAFFGVHTKQTNYMDPQHRMLLEVAYEAIVDAGVDPNTIRGSNTGVFVGAQKSEPMYLWKDSHSQGKSGYSLTGTALSMLATRVTFSFDFKGPSYVIDTACSSTMYAFSTALQSMRNGACDAAIVGGVNVDVIPDVALTFTQLGMTSPDGKCKHLDKDANGYVRSEGITAVYLQKKKDAKRIYCYAVHAKTNSDGHKSEGITNPSAQMQRQLLIDTYKEAGINPLDVTYLEAHGTGTSIGDPKEVKAVCEALCEDRKGPLMIGSVKSNMGHCESASAGASLAKVIIAMEEKVIPANLHFKTPNENIPELQNGKLQVVSQNTGWKGGYIGVNSFGFGGANAHAILKSNDEPVSKAEYRETVRLFVYGSRTKEGVEHILKAIETNPNNIYFHKLLNETACMPVKTHPYRGFTVLNNGLSETNVKVRHILQAARPGTIPVWFVFSGMGSQWKGMGRDLMEIDVFRESIMKLSAVLVPYDVDLFDCLMNDKKDVFTDVVNTFVGIISVQIALVDLLKCVGISPDGIVGHSVGEVACAYADGCLTAEEAVLTAYWRGMCIKNAKLPPCSMAAIGLTWQDALNQCPPGVVPACHNAEDSVTVSGPAEDVNNFVTELQQKDVFAKEINSNGIAFHSYFMVGVAKDLKKVLDKVITPKVRTSRWVSSSFPKSEWLTDMATMSSADYFIHNLVSPVLFHEAIGQVPDDAVVIEISPHSLLLPVLKRSLDTKSCLLGLMKRNSAENIKQCLSSLGTCFQMGINLDPLKLSTSVSFPVPSGTPMISPLIKWDHSQSWEVPKYNVSKTKNSVTVDLTSKDSDDYYLLEHRIEGRHMLPGASLIVMVWQALAQREGKEWTEMPVLFKDFALHRGTFLKVNDKLHLEVELIQGTDSFQVTESNMVIASGTVTTPGHKQMSALFRNRTTTKKLVIPTDLTTEDLYKTFRLQGYEYGPSFQGLLGTNFDGSQGVLKWTGNWVTFIDCVAQIGILSSHSLSLPVRYSTLVIDPFRQRKSIVDIGGGLQGTECFRDNDTETREAGGVYSKDLINVQARRKAGKEPIHEAYTFIPYNQLVNIYEDEVIKYAENVSGLARYILSVLLEQGFSLDYMLKRSVTTDRTACCKYEDEIKESTVSNSNKERHSYLHFLMNINASIKEKDFKARITDITNNHLKDGRSDLLLGYLMQAKYLKQCIDIVAENILTVNFKVAGIGNVGMVDSVNEMINAQPFFNSSCILVSDVSQANDGKQGPKNQEPVVWTPESSIPDVLRRRHLVVVSHALRKYRNLSKALTGLSNLLDDGGYLLIQEVTANFHIAALQDNTLQSREPYFDDLKRRTCSIYCDASTWKQRFTEEGFIVVQEISDSLLTSLFLLKKRVQRSTEYPTMLTITENNFGWVEELQLKLKNIYAHEKDDRIWLKADGNVCGILGLVNCLRREPGGYRIRCVFNMDDNKTIDNVTINSLTEKDLAMNVYSNGEWGSYRHSALKPVKPVPSEYAYVNIQNRGDMSSLGWSQSPLRYYSLTDIENDQLCNVHYASLNFRDVMLASGKISAQAIPGAFRESECLLGMEFSGTDDKHNRVMGLVSHQGIATKVKVGKNNVWPVPEGWTLKQAATVPVVYFTAYYALVVRARIRSKNSVLIHAGSGGVGQAAITLALHYGCKVFTTVGSEEKRNYLKERFPELDESNIFSSRDTAFECGIQKATAGRGVDIVLNSLADEKLQSSVKVLAEHGHFLEIGKFDLAKNSSLGMSVFLKNITFHGILTDALFEVGNEEMIMASQCLSEGIKIGVVKPLQTTVFNTDQVEDAFRYMAQGKHIGKVLIKVADHDRPVCLPALPRTYFDPVKTYIITGGLGGFGLELASWMIERGARFIILTSRSGKIKTGYQARKLKIFHDLGAKVSISSADICDFQESDTLLQSTDTPIGGIFHLAVVLADSLFENQTVDSFKSVCNPKINGVKNLDQLTRRLCKDSLDWFVVFSSIASGRGNIGQSSYGFANSAMERMCEQRVRDGLPGLAIQWGPIGDVGVFIDTVGGNETVVGGTIPQRLLSCLQSLDDLLHQNIPVVSSFVHAEKVQTERRKTTDTLMQTICKIMGITDQSANVNTSFADLGMDSLINVEIKLILETDYNINLSSKEIEELTLSKLTVLADGIVNQDKKENTATRKADKLMAYLAKTYLAVTRPTKNITKLNDINEGMPLFIVHDLFGTTNHLDQIVSQLKVPVYGLMRTADLPETNLVETAACYVKAINLIHANREPFHLAGYSFGAVVAQEMALRLQESQSTPLSLILLDGSSRMLNIPNDIQTTADAAVKLRLAAIGVDIDLIMDLRARPEKEKQIIDEKIERVLSVLKEMKFDASVDDMKKFILIYLTAVNAMGVYQPDKMYKGDVTLIAAEESVRPFGQEVELAVGKFTSGEVTVKSVSGNHFTFVKDESGDEVADLINRVLLQDDKNKAM